VTHRDHAGDPPGRREAAGDAGHRQGLPTPAPIRPLPVRPRDRNGGFPRLSGCVAQGLRCPASPRHALLAENLGKPSLWVITKDLWYNITEIVSSDLGQHPAVLVDLDIVANHHAELRVGLPRRELLGQVLFWNTVDLERKLRCFHLYSNHSRTHASLDGNTPAEMSGDAVMHPAALRHFTWEKHCGGHFELPIAA